MANKENNLLAEGLAGVATQTTKLAVNFVTGDLISVGYDTLSGNQPNTYGNMAAIWQNSNQIPWPVEPLNRQNVPTNTPAGDMNFTGLEITKNSYIIGYAVGPDVENIVASAYVPAGSDQAVAANYEYDSVSLSLKFVGATSVAVGYHTLAGYQPASNSNWLGMWESNSASYTTKPKWTTKPIGDAPNGTASFNNIVIVRGGIYTVAYFLGSKQTMMAATLTFTA